MPSCILNYAQDRIWEKSFLQVLRYKIILKVFNYNVFPSGQIGKVGVNGRV